MGQVTWKRPYPAVPQWSRRPCLAICGVSVCLTLLTLFFIYEDPVKLTCVSSSSVHDIDGETSAEPASMFSFFHIMFIESIKPRAQPPMCLAWLQHFRKEYVTVYLQ
mmetsp:Transcript_16871/g.31683  ORF Transcript_16871/g.31683 Transcript_16871/m.31683 type:complete len:107 (-) Transcript_16871:2151-2471(-)